MLLTDWSTLLYNRHLEITLIKVTYGSFRGGQVSAAGKQKNMSGLLMMSKIVKFHLGSSHLIIKQIN